MQKNLQEFVQKYFFALKKISASPEATMQEAAQLKDLFTEAGFEGFWTERLPEMEELVGAPINSWHAGHLAKMKGQSLPEWDKRDTYLNGFGTTHRLEELQRQAAETLAKMKYALVREALTRHAQLHDVDVQTKMKGLLNELYEKSRKDPMIFLGHLANRQFALTSFGNTAKPSAQWSKSEKTTELVCQLANLTFLHIQTSLQTGNNIEQKNIPTDAVTDISVP